MQARSDNDKQSNNVKTIHRIQFIKTKLDADVLFPLTHTLTTSCGDFSYIWLFHDCRHDSKEEATLKTLAKHQIVFDQVRDLGISDKAADC